MCWPLRICRNVVRTAEFLLRIDQCCLGSEKEGIVKSRPGNNGGLASTFAGDSSVVFSFGGDCDNGCWR